MNTSHKKNNLLKQTLKNIHAQKRIDSSVIINLFINLFISLVIRNIEVEETDNYDSEDSETYTKILTNIKDLEINKNQEKINE